MTDIKQLRSRIVEDVPHVQAMAVKKAKLVRITAGELRAVCDGNPAHPLAASKRKSAAPFPDDHMLYVEQVDLLALIDNAEVAIDEVIEGDSRVIRKRLVPKTVKPLPAPAPAVKEPVTKDSK